MEHTLIPASSALLRARISGALYVLCIDCGFFAEMVVRAKLVVYSDAVATARNIAAAPGLYRAGFFADVSAMTLGVLSSVLLYTLLKAVSRGLALTVLVLDVIGNAVSISGSILLFAPLIILQGDAYLAVLTAPQLGSLALLSIKLYESAYAISLGLFSGSCLLTGYLIFRSTFLPRAIGVLLIAGVNSARWNAIARTQTVQGLPGMHRRRISSAVRRSPMPALLALCAATATVYAADSPTAPAASPGTMAEVLAASKPSDWRALDPENTLYMELASGRIVIELAPRFAPNHVATIRALAREHYYDGLVIERVQDDYVAQWGDPDDRRSTGTVPRTLASEFSRSSDGLEFVRLPDPDTYASETGFVDGFPAARDLPSHLAWLTHCYAMVGAGRDNDANSGGGRELYVVIGQAPRHLDRNVTLVGRVVQGIEQLSSLPRGGGPLGFFQHPSERIPIRSIRIAADIPASRRSRLEVLRTDTQTFTELIETRRNRREEWFKVPAGRIDVCNMPLPVRNVSAHP